MTILLGFFALSPLEILILLLLGLAALVVPAVIVYAIVHAMSPRRKQRVDERSLHEEIDRLREEVADLREEVVHLRAENARLAKDQDTHFDENITGLQP